MKAPLLLVLFGLLFLSTLRASAAFVPAPAPAAHHPSGAAHRESFGHRLRRVFPLPFDNRREIAKTETNGWAIASFVCGIVSLFFAGIPLGVCAIIFGALGLNRRKNRGLAIAGLILGIVGVIGAFIAISMMK